MKKNVSRIFFIALAVFIISGCQIKPSSNNDTTDSKTTITDPPVYLGYTLGEMTANANIMSRSDTTSDTINAGSLLKLTLHIDNPKRDNLYQIEIYDDNCLTHKGKELCIYKENGELHSIPSYDAETTMNIVLVLPRTIRTDAMERNIKINKITFMRDLTSKVDADLKTKSNDKDVMKFNVSSKFNENSISDTGIYTTGPISISNISKAWLGNSTNPSFSILFLNANHVDLLESWDTDFVKGTEPTDPVYQLASFGNITFDTVFSGTLSPLAINWTTKEINYYDGIAVKVTDSTVEVLIDLAKIKKEQLKVIAKDVDRVTTSTDIVDITNYLPCSIALTDNTDDRIATGWNADLISLKPCTEYPVSIEKREPLPSTLIINNNLYGNYKLSLTDTSMTDKILECDFTYNSMSVGYFYLTNRANGIYGVTSLIVDQDFVELKEITTEEAEKTTITGLEYSKKYKLKVDFSTSPYRVKIETIQ